MYNLTNVRILCIDDNAHMQHILWVSLSSMGFTKVKFAQDGAEALELLLTNEFDMILCDLNMAPIGGIEFIQTVRRQTQSDYYDIPIIVVSGNTESRLVCEARDAGATEFLAKPISVHDLYKRIEYVIEKPREFLTKKAFVGPDRRRRRNAEFDGEDRRSEG